MFLPYIYYINYITNFIASKLLFWVHLCLLRKEAKGTKNGLQVSLMNPISYLNPTRRAGATQFTVSSVMEHKRCICGYENICRERLNRRNLVCRSIQESRSFKRQTYSRSRAICVPNSEVIICFGECGCVIINE